MGNLVTELAEPPFAESLVRSDVESLFRGGCLSKGIGDVGTQDKQVFCGSKGVEDARAGLIDAVGVGVVKDTDLSRSGGAVTRASCLLAFVQFLDDICPDEVEDCLVGVHPNRFPEHSLVVVLIELCPFGGTPFIPVWLLEEFTSCEPVHDGLEVPHVATLNLGNLVAGVTNGQARDVHWCPLECGVFGWMVMANVLVEMSEHEARVQLINVDLKDTCVGEAMTDGRVRKYQDA